MHALLAFRTSARHAQLYCMPYFRETAASSNAVSRKQVRACAVGSTHSAQVACHACMHLPSTPHHRSAYTNTNHMRRIVESVSTATPLNLYTRLCVCVCSVSAFVLAWLKNSSKITYSQQCARVAVCKLNAVVLDSTFLLCHWERDWRTHAIHPMKSPVPHTQLQIPYRLAFNMSMHILHSLVFDWKPSGSDKFWRVCKKKSIQLYGAILR